MSTASPETSPAQTAAAASPKQTALMKRLARMREHKDFEAAMAHVPPSEETLETCARERRRAAVLLVLGAASVGNALRLSGWLGQAFFGAVGVALAAWGAKRLLAAAARSSAYLGQPLRKVPALVADRRSETDLAWMGGRTTYHFQLELDDGTSAEFKYPGRGTQDELLVKGNTGLAYLRGDTLIAWKHIKV